MVQSFCQSKYSFIFLEDKKDDFAGLTFSIRPSQKANKLDESSFFFQLCWIIPFNEDSPNTYNPCKYLLLKDLLEALFGLQVVSHITHTDTFQEYRKTVVVDIVLLSICKQRKRIKNSRQILYPFVYVCVHFNSKSSLYSGFIALIIIDDDDDNTYGITAYTFIVTGYLIGRLILTFSFGRLEAQTNFQ